MLGRLINRSVNRSAEPTDGGSLAVVRIVFGAVGALTVVRIVGYGWVEDLYAGAPRRFTYPGLGWVAPPGVAGTYLLLGVVGLAALAVMVGWWYRPAIVVFVVGFAWIEFLDVTTYLNHYWFMTTLGLIMTVAPMDARFAVRGRPTRMIRRGWVWLVRVHVAVVYVFAGLAKLHGDWLAARDAAAALAPRPVGPPTRRSGARTAVDRLRAQLGGCGVRLQHRGVAAVATHSCVGVGGRRGVPRGDVGAVPDRCVPVVDDRRDHDLLRARLAGTDRRRRCAPGDVGRITSRSVRLFLRRPVASARGTGWPPSLWVMAIVAIPLRHHLIPGDARWTNEGYRFSWNVLLTEKGADVRFRLTEPATGRRLGRDGRGSVHARAVAGDGERSRVDPPGRPRHRRCLPRPGPHRRGARRCVRVVQRATGASPRRPDRRPQSRAVPTVRPTMDPARPDRRCRPDPPIRSSEPHAIAVESQRFHSATSGSYAAATFARDDRG